MDIKRIMGLSGIWLVSSAAIAGTMGPAEALYRPVIAVHGGYAAITAGNSNQAFFGTDSDLFSYSSHTQTTNTGFVGAFIGIEAPLRFLTTHPGWFVQLGAEYDYFGDAIISGSNSVGLTTPTSDIYPFQYKLQAQQVLGLFRLYTTIYDRFLPYAEAGIGASFNQARSFTIGQTVGNVNIAPIYPNASQTQLSYVFGAGVETALYDRIRVGLGYRYSNFGSFALGNGGISFNNYQFPVPFALSGSNSYANELIVRLSYLA